jgi:hypothetical protein
MGVRIPEMKDKMEELLHAKKPNHKPGFHPAGLPGPAQLPCHQASAPRAQRVSTHWPARLQPAHWPTSTPARWPTGPPELQPTDPLGHHRPTSHHLPQEGSNTTRHWLQTYQGDADKQDWCYRSNTRTTKNEILLFLNKEIFIIFFFHPFFSFSFFSFL